MSNFSDRLASLSQKQRDLLLLRLTQAKASRPPLVPRPERAPIAPASFAQQRMWFLDQMQPHCAAYNIPSALLLRGTLHISALQQSLQEVVQRHEVLRTTFAMVDGQTVQVIAPSLQVNLPLVDLTSYPEEVRDEEAQRRATEEARYPFDLSTGPLFRAALCRLAADKHLLIVIMHHSISDGWSLGVLVREMSALYEAFVAGRSSPLAALPVQYADFAVWQRQWLQSTALQGQMDYWKKQLRGNLPVLQLPTDHPRPAIQSYRGDTYSLVLPQQLTEALKKLGKQEDATPFMVLLAAFKVLLYRYTRQSDLIVGTPIANRNLHGSEDLIGFFANTLALRADLSGNPTFRETLQRIRKVALEAYEHQDIPFEQLVEALQPVRDMSYTPLFQVLFALQNAPPPLQLAGLTLELQDITNQTAKFDLSLSVIERNSQLACTFEYNTDLFAETTISRVAQHFSCLLADLVAHPTTSIERLTLLPPVEREQLLHTWNRTAVRYPPHGCLHELVEAQVACTPHATALVFEQQHLSYAELNARANQLAWRLRQAGVGAEVPVAICADRSLALVVGLLAILKAGGAYVPLDPTYPPERLVFMLRDCQAPVLLIQPALAVLVPIPPATSVLLLEEPVQPEPETAPNLPVVTRADNLAYIIYTSGSTGTPKGVMNTHRGICNRLLWMQATYQLQPHDHVLQKTPYSFDVSVWEFFWPLLAGAPLVLTRPQGHQDSAYLRQLIIEQQISVLHFVPSMLRVFLEEPGVENCTSLRAIICSGEALPLDVQESCLARIPAELHNLYGPTEAAIDVSFWHCIPEKGQRSVPIGRPLANLQLYVLDAQGQPVPIGVPGELFIGGVGLARGYLQRADLTAERFVPHPYTMQLGERLYRTGDLVRYRTDGALEFLGRLDHQVKVRGFRIELGEIETVLQQYPGVQEAVVVAHVDNGEGTRLIAYVVTSEGASPPINVLRSFLNERLPEYMLPSAFVNLPALPLTPNGKLDRQALPMPDTARPHVEEMYVASRSVTEETLAAIWTEVLRLEKVGIDDNFFTLGGDSIRSITVLAKAKERGLLFSLQQLFKYPTIRALAAHANTSDLLQTGISSEPFSLISTDERLRLPGDVEDAYPLSTLQAGLVFQSELHRGTAMYHDIMTYRIRGPFDAGHFRAAVQRLVDRHPILRTAYALSGFRQPLQLVYRHIEAPLIIKDIREIPPAGQERLIAEFMVQEQRWLFAWSQPGLIRFIVHRLSADLYHYTLSIHDSVLDGWSTNALNTELFHTYAQLLKGEKPPVVTPPASTYRDFVAAEQALLSSDQAKRYWEQQLRDSEATHVPRWLDAPTEIQAARICYAQVPLTREISDGLKRLALRAVVPLKSVLLAAHVYTLARLTNQEDVLTGIEHNGRLEEREGEQCLGLFLNTVPFRFCLQGGNWIKLIQQVLRAEMELLPFRRYPFATLKRSGAPLAETIFNYTHFHVTHSLFALEGMELVEHDAVMETEFPLRAEFSRNVVSDNIDFSLHYDLAVFPAEQIEQIAHCYVQTLTHMVDDPLQQYWQASLLSAQERERLLTNWNATQRSVPYDQSFAQLFEAQVERTPSNIAAICDQERVSYQELNQRANCMAHALIKRGVGPEVLVALLAERSLAFLTAVLAVFKAGGAYLPLDAHHPPRRIAHILSESGSRLVLVTQPFTDLLAQALEENPPAERPAQVQIEDILAQRGSHENVPLRGTAENLAYVIYTSGSTGKPKGAMVVQRGMVNHLFAKITDLQLHATDSIAQTASQCFDISVWQFLAALVVGGCTVIYRDEIAYDPARLMRSVQAHKVSILETVPSLLRAMLDIIATWQPERRDLPALRWLIPTGEALPPDLCRQWFAYYPAIPLLNAYGPTECSDDVTHYPISQAPAATVTHMPIGRPIVNTRLYVLDRYLNPVPLGTPGELYVGGLGVGRGYLHEPQRTAEAFLPDPFAAEAAMRLYKTGDRVRYLPGGVIEFLGRLDYQVKVRGFRIELGEIEASLMRHPSVRECVVVTREDTLGDLRLVAYVVPQQLANEANKVSVKELRTFMRQALPDYMLPSLFVVLDALPLTSNGKIDRSALPAASATSDQGADFVAPESSEEQLIANLWQEVLGVEKVGVHDNFFDLGGHSLLLVQLHSKLQEALGKDIPMVTFFQYTTVSSLAQHLFMAKSSNTVSLQQKVQDRAEARRTAVQRRLQTRTKR